MAQKTDLNVSPYYDDFDKEKNFYKVLFKPGYPVQSRELNNIQSIFQNQVESFGNNIFKEGSMVLPGSTSYDNQFNSVKLNLTNLGVDVSLYINNLIGKTITGSSSGVKASVQYVVFPSESDLVDTLTIYVKYLSAGNDSETTIFQDGEQLVADENIVYGNTTITSGTPFASLISSDATSIGSAVSIDDGVYFIRGTFVDVLKQTIILDYYTNNPNYRVGLKVSETIIRAKDDESLYDNANGFTNYAAPGADRFKISLTLTKKPLTDLNDKDFIEILRVDNGKLKKVADKPVYNVIRDYIAERTFDESGHYTVDEFTIKILNSLNNRIDNDGIFLENETTDQGNTPSDDLMCVQVSPGKAYVAGYDVDFNLAENIDVEKPRDTQTESNVNVPFEMGHLLRVNNVEGAPKENETITLRDKFKTNNASTIGKARVYTFNLTDAAYSGAETQWDLYLYDIQTYTNLTFNRSVTSAEVPATSFIQGKSSGASGYAVNAGSGDTLSIYQTSGTFLQDEQLIVNGVDAALSLKSFIAYGSNDIKSVRKINTTGFPDFKADCVLTPKKFSNGISNINVSAGSTVTSPGKLFSGIKEGDYISVIDGGNLKYNTITFVSPDLSSFNISGINTVTGVFDGGLISGGNYNNPKIRVSKLKNRKNASLYAKLPDKNVSSVNLSNSQLLVTRQIDDTEGLTISGNTLTFDLSNVSGITSASYETFDQERYSVHYDDGRIATITPDSFKLSGNTVNVVGLASTTNPVVVNTTLVKNGIQSKIKEYTRSAIRTVDLSTLARSGAATSDSINDGLTYNQYYGLRVQDDQISLNVPDVSKVLAVYESTNTGDPVLDRVEFSSISQVDTDAIIGEDIVGSDSGAVARVVLNSSTTPSVPSNNLGIIYLNGEKFSVGETVTFKESNIVSTIQSITLGKYKDITNNFVLDKGQKNEYYDYSRIIRTDVSIPQRRLLIVFDHYTVPSSDNGDVFTALSYDADRFAEDIPTIGSRRRGVRSSDVLDFRPRVVDYSSTTSSPFAFDSRDFGSDPKFVLKPKEGSLIGYDFYLPRIDRVYLDKFGSVLVRKGISSKNPVPPLNEDTSLMQLAEISLPAYLYDPDDASITMIDNRRYTMRDIGNLEDRVESLERYTSLSLLELNTESLKIEDSDGNDRFKSGFFVDDFRDDSLSDRRLTSANINRGSLRPFRSRNSLQQRPIPSSEISEEQLDLSDDYSLLDPNVQKTGNRITLKYKSVGWLEQSLATRLENVNPFHVVEYTGLINLSPDSDTWVRTIRIPEKIKRVTVNLSRTLRNERTVERNEEGERDSVSRRTSTSSTSSTTTNVRSRSVDVIVSSGSEKYIRSRNVSFFGVNFEPLRRYYQFLDGHSNVDFIPKLVEIANSKSLENYGTSNGSFKKGETVYAYGSDGSRIGSFRLASSNHKKGKFNSPSSTYTTNPYVTTENIASSYSQSSKTLNIDLNALSAEAQGEFFGYLVKGGKLVGQTSGAVAYVKNLRLISDDSGSLFGAFFIKNPHTNPAPNPRILTGKKTYTLSSSKSNKSQIAGSTAISSGSATYNATGRLRNIQLQTTVTTTNTTTTTITSTTSITRTTARPVPVRRQDPLAQSFTVGRDIEAPDFVGQNDDDNGVFLTAIDLFFGSKPKGSAPLTVDIRTVELGIPTLNSIADPKTLTPDEILTSADGTVATKVTFDNPIYLAPGNEYAIVLLAPNSNKYEVWTARMGQKTIGTQNLPDSETIRYSKQFAIGSLFKSQNGSIWTPAQKSDLKFKLYKAKFTANTGIAHFANPPLNESNGYVPTLDNNPLVALPKEVAVGIDTISSGDSLNDTLTSGRRIAGSITNSFGSIISVGSSVSGISTTNVGTNYTTTSASETQSIFGSGTGLTINIDSVGAGGTIIDISIANPGNGYAVGDAVSIVNASTETGRNAVITISAIDGIDTLYLTNVQGDTGAFQVGAALSYYDTDSTIVSLGSTTITSVTPNTGFYSGNRLEVNHFNHGMYAVNNKLKLDNIESDIASSTLSARLRPTQGSSDIIEVPSSDSSIFETFEGQPVDSTNVGYIKIGDEVISYNNVNVPSGQLTIAARGIEGVIQDHDKNSPVMKYEFAGVSLRRINGVTHDIVDDGIESGRYYIDFDRTSTYGIDRSSDATYPQLSFSSELIGGGSRVTASENILYNRINPRFDILSPGKETNVTATIRTTSGTSISGSEASFQLLNQVEPVILNQQNSLSSVRMVCSRINELNQSSFDNVIGRRSFTTAITLNTNNENLSPMINIDNSTVEYISDTINRPVTNFVTDSSSNSLDNDPHQAVYVSNVINLSQPASSLKVLLSAYRPEQSDIRVLYSLVRDDSSEIEQEFELFPGYKNLQSTSDGVLRVVDSSLNDGRPDFKVPASEEDQFLEYEFTANDLPDFSGYRVKVIMASTNQANSPIIRDLRTIALK